MSVKCFNLKNGINLYHIPETKFKTSYVSINIHNELSIDNASKCALLADVMQRGSKKYPDETSISKFLQNLYGAYFSTGIKRKGIDQILSFSATCVDDRFLPDGEKCLDKILEFLFDMLLEPLSENDSFNRTYVEQEKVNLINDINALVNEKRSYSVWRLIENMCEDDAYSVHELGTVESVEKINEKSLYEFYKSLLSKGPIDIFVTGNIEPEKVLKYAQDRLRNINLSCTEYPQAELFNKDLRGKEITERFDVTQSKLCLGYKTNVSPKSRDYYKLMVYSGILGGGAHSKLFNEVREKLSLAYYAGSKIERYNSLMIVSAGIEGNNKQKALDEIAVQIEKMKNGDFTDEEFDATIKSIVNSLRSMGDSIAYLSDYYLSQAITNSNISLDEFIEEIKSVTKEDVKKVAQGVELQMIYFLTGKEGEGK